MKINFNHITGADIKPIVPNIQKKEMPSKDEKSSFDNQFYPDKASKVYFEGSLLLEKAKSQVKNNQEKIKRVINKTSKIREIYQNNGEFIKELVKKGYKPTILTLQNSNKIDVVFSKIKKTEDKKGNSFSIQNCVRLDKNGVISKSKRELFTSKDNEKGFQATRTSDGKYSRYSYFNNCGLDREIRIVNGATRPIYIEETKASPIMEEAFDTTIYDLEEIDENIDVIKGIRKGEIKGREIAKTFKMPDGEVVHREEFQKGELHTKREYRRNNDKTKTSLDYTISDLSGKKLLDIHRTFKLDDNKSVSTINGEKYEAEFDDKKMKVKIGDVEINFKEKLKYNTTEHQKKLWASIKKTPADLILDLGDISEICYAYDHGYMGYNILGTDESLSILAHELGHKRDITNNNLYTTSEISEKIENCDREKLYALSNNPELIKIYNKEIEDLKRNISEGEQWFFEYFSQISPSTADGLGELLAEVNRFCTTQDKSNRKQCQLYLSRYFPMTIAKSAELLGYNNA